MSGAYAYIIEDPRFMAKRVCPSLGKAIQYIKDRFTAWDAITSSLDIRALSYDKETDTEHFENISIRAFTEERQLPADELAQIEKELDEAISTSRLDYARDAAKYPPGQMPRYSGQSYLFEHSREDLLKRTIWHRALRWKENV